jgi:hypothetical protein
VHFQHQFLGGMCMQNLRHFRTGIDILFLAVILPPNAQLPLQGLACILAPLEQFWLEKHPKTSSSV